MTATPSLSKIDRLPLPMEKPLAMVLACRCPSAPANWLGRSPASGPPSARKPCCLPGTRVRIGPALVKPDLASQLAELCRCTPCAPGGRSCRSKVTSTPRLTASNTTVPTGLPSRLESRAVARAFRAAPAGPAASANAAIAKTKCLIHPLQRPKPAIAAQKGEPDGCPYALGPDVHGDLNMRLFLMTATASLFTLSTAMMIAQEAQAVQ